MALLTVLGFSGPGGGTPPPKPPTPSFYRTLPLPPPLSRRGGPLRSFPLRPLQRQQPQEEPHSGGVGAALRQEDQPLDVIALQPVQRGGGPVARLRSGGRDRAEAMAGGGGSVESAGGLQADQDRKCATSVSPRPSPVVSLTI